MEDAQLGKLSLMIPLKCSSQSDANTQRAMKLQVAAFNTVFLIMPE